MRSWLPLYVATALVAACSPSVVAVPGATAPATESATQTSSGATCQPSDQIGYVYHPDRLAVQSACLRITGTVLAVKSEADGDRHVRVQLDPPYVSMLRPANDQQCAQGVCGLLVVEPVCVGPVSQADAVDTCSADHDPLTGLPSVGQRVWMEGRYVFDLDHDGWAELHPLYRWGAA